MKKVRLYQRKDRPGWHVSWRENGKERKRSFPNKKIADHYCQIKYVEINNEVFRSLVDLPWDDLVAEYLRTYDVRRLTPAAKYEGHLTLRHFERLVGPVSSQNISQGVIDAFITERAQAVGDWTLNKDISNFRAFLRWGQKHRYLSMNLEVHKVKATPRLVASLSDAQIHNLLISARQRSECWYLRVLLAVTTGLRSQDIERLELGDIDFEQNAVCTRSKKTRKLMAARPLHSSVVPVLLWYVADLQDGQVKLLGGDTNTHKKWKRIRQRAGLPDLRFQDLRAVFSTALQARDVPLSVVQDLLEHSSPELTQRIYTNTDRLLAPAVERLPVNEWL